MTAPLELLRHQKLTNDWTLHNTLKECHCGAVCICGMMLLENIVREWVLYPGWGYTPLWEGFQAVWFVAKAEYSLLCETFALLYA